MITQQGIQKIEAENADLRAQLAEFKAFPNVDALRQCMVDTANENARLKGELGILATGHLEAQHRAAIENSRLKEENADARKALEDLASCDEVEDGEHGDGPACFFCGGLVKHHGLDMYVEHKSDCVLQTARTFLEVPRKTADVVKLVCPDCGGLALTIKCDSCPWTNQPATPREDSHAE